VDVSELRDVGNDLPAILPDQSPITVIANGIKLFGFPIGDGQEIKIPNGRGALTVFSFRYSAIVFIGGVTAQGAH